MQSIRGRVLEALPPTVIMRLRVEKNRRKLGGIYAPASFLSSLVPAGSAAVDAGANVGLYAYWIARQASVVHAFEPNPDVFGQLQSSAGRKVRTYNYGLSDHESSAVLHVPSGASGDASLIPHDDPETEYAHILVQLRTLDSFDLAPIGFLKVDVEGHEEELLTGSRETISRNKPVVFMEIEERHRQGAVERITTRMREDFGYSNIAFLRSGELHPFKEFDLSRDQLALAATLYSPQYVNNFLFQP